MQAYSNPDREDDPHALPDLEVFELTPRLVAALDGEMVYEYGKRREFQLYNFNGRTREAMLDAMVAENNIMGGWFYWYCFPGCLPDTEPHGPFPTRDAALADALENA